MDITNEQLTFVKASASSGGGQCAEMARLPQGRGVRVRDSKNPDGPVSRG